MDCCQCQGIEAKFDQEYVTKKLDKYRRQGPKETTRQLIEALQAKGVEEMTLLDIGGGVGISSMNYSNLVFGLRSTMKPPQPMWKHVGRKPNGKDTQTGCVICKGTLLI